MRTALEVLTALPDVNRGLRAHQDLHTALAPASSVARRYIAIKRILHMPGAPTPFPPLKKLAEDLSAKRTTSRALVETALDRINDPCGQGSAVFTFVNADLARAAADEQDKLRSAGVSLPVLAGIPISVKDTIDVEGQATRAGSRVLADAPPAIADAPVISRLRSSATVFVGRTNMSEFAFDALGLNTLHGNPLSPYHRDVVGDERIAGGSSSGAAASVSDGMAAVALGTDTGGSIRIPAAMCGMTGFKPTATRIPREGRIPLSVTLDSMGVVGVTVSCCAILDSVLRGTVYREDGLRPLAGVRLGVLSNYVMDGLDPSVARAFASAVDCLSRAGANIKNLRLPALDRLPEINKFGFSTIESYAWHRKYLTTRQDAYDPRVYARIIRGKAASAADYLDLLAARAAMLSETETSLWSQIDAVMVPTVPIEPPRLADLINDDEEFARTNALVFRNSSVFNFLDACALSLPCHRYEDAPVGLTLAAAPHADEALLAIGRSIESTISSIR